MADYLRGLMDALPPEDQADVAAFMADPGMADPDSLQLPAVCLQVHPVECPVALLLHKETCCL